MKIFSKLKNILILTSILALLSGCSASIKIPAPGGDSSSNSSSKSSK